MAVVLALVVFCIGLWATAAVPEYWTALAFFLIAVAAGIAPADTVFSGFRSSTFWLLFSGIVLGAAFRHTGFDTRLADSLTRLLGAHYAGIYAEAGTPDADLATIEVDRFGVYLAVPLGACGS